MHLTIGHASIKPKAKAKNQDWVDNRLLDNELEATFALADGVGSSDFSEKGAEEAVKVFLDIIDNKEIDSGILHEQWSEQVARLSLTNSKDGYRTTLIGGQIDEKRIRFYYVGNGGK